MVSNIESRIKKLEEKLNPNKAMVVCIHYGTNEGFSSVIINEKRFIVPDGTRVKDFINEKTKHLSGVVTCIVYSNENNQTNKE